VFSKVFDGIFNKRFYKIKKTW